MSTYKATERLFTIIEQLKKPGTKLCTKKLSITYDIDVKTIQNDFKFIRKYFGEDILVQTQRGCYELNSKEHFVNTLSQNQEDGEQLRGLMEFIALFDEDLLEKFDVEKFPLIEKIKKEQQTLYHIHSHPIEKLNTPFMADIRKAVKNRRYVNMTYDAGRGVQKYPTLKVARIVFAEGNWYLATVDEEDNFRFLRINLIKSFNLLTNSFHRDIEVDRFIKNFQSLFSSYKEPHKKVRLKVDKQKAHFFKTKQYLNSQRMVEEQKDGSLVLEFDVTNYMEIKRIVHRWTPYVVVIEPEELKAELLQEAKRFVEKQKNVKTN